MNPSTHSSVWALKQSLTTSHFDFLWGFVLVFFLCLCPLCASAFNVKGRVASATDDTSLQGATIRLLMLPDSTFLTGGYSDKDGNFSLETSRVKKNDKLCVVLTYIGFQNTIKTFSIHESKPKSYDLKDVYMQEDSRLLGEAIVSATPPPMVIKEDTIEYYADSYKTQPDAVVEDLLKRLPGVEIANDGTITAQGETVQQIYVDGKEFFGSNIEVTTKNLTADMLESVQIVDMKSEEARLSGIDDGERRKVINLKLKPKMRRGWFGNAASAWGKGKGIDDRFEGKGMLGYFRGNYQNALIANGNNTNNSGFGDLGDHVLGGSSMRGNRQSGGRGDGLKTSWSTGINVNYDEGNRMQSANTPLALGGDAMYGGSKQDEHSKTHKINYLKNGNTVNDSENEGHNQSQNVQLNLKFEKSFGDEKQHRIMIRPNLSYNETETDEASSSQTHYEDRMVHAGDTLLPRYISQTQRNSNMDQRGINYGVTATYSHTQKLDRGKRRSSVTLGLSGQANKGNDYTYSCTSFDSLWVADLTMNNDTIINQKQEEKGHNESWRIRLTHVEPIAPNHFIEASATVNHSVSQNKQTYLFWDDALLQYVEELNGVSNQSYNADTRLENNKYTASISYRNVCEKYNLNVGMDFLPQTQEYEDALDHTRDYKRHFVNYAPKLDLRYYWSRQQVLRVQYSGKTNQPSMSQLQARKNQTSATHVRLGNKDLEPSFTNSLNVRYRSFNTETYRTFEAVMSVNAAVNSLSSKRWYSEDLRSDTTMTVNISGLGNWNASTSFNASLPFYDNLWYVTTDTRLTYQRQIGYANLKGVDSNINRTHTQTAREQAGIAYRGEHLNVELRGNYQIQHVKASLSSAANLGTTQTFGSNMNIQYRFPWDITLSSDIRYTGRRGYSAGIDRNQTIWNAQVSKLFNMKKKSISCFIKVFDILQERSSISRNITATALIDRETTVLGQYFLMGASIRFNKMGARGGRKGDNGNTMNREKNPRTPQIGARGNYNNNDEPAVF